MTLFSEADEIRPESRSQEMAGLRDSHLVETVSQNLPELHIIKLAKLFEGFPLFGRCGEMAFSTAFSTSIVSWSRACFTVLCIIWAWKFTCNRSFCIFFRLVKTELWIP